MKYYDRWQAIFRMTCSISDRVRAPRSHAHIHTYTRTHTHTWSTQVHTVALIALITANVTKRLNMSSSERRYSCFEGGKITCIEK